MGLLLGNMAPRVIGTTETLVRVAWSSRRPGGLAAIFLGLSLLLFCTSPPAQVPGICRDPRMIRSVEVPGISGGAGHLPGNKTPIHTLRS